MNFPRGGLLSQFGQPFDDTVRAALPTVAEPALFAPPVDVRQDAAALTIDFHVADGEAVRVEAHGRSLFVWGPRLEHGACPAGRERAMRLFALPFEASPYDLTVMRVRDLLRVRLAKRRAQVSPESMPQAA